MISEYNLVRMRSFYIAPDCPFVGLPHLVREYRQSTDASGLDENGRRLDSLRIWFT